MPQTLATDKNEIYGALPGFEVPVGEALSSLSKMWDAPAETEGSRPPSEFRASRMNFILHFGFDALLDEAKDLFRRMIDFSRKYPCRIIALCPAKDENATGQGIVCKIFSECYIGEGGNDMSCCEALIFGYTLKEKEYLEDQISVFLESDLPTYYWPYRFDSPVNLSDYQSFFKSANRIVIDSAVESYEPQSLRLPQPEKLHDLAVARTLPIRQCIGQFFSAIPVKEIVSDLQSVEIEAPGTFRAEGSALLSWLKGVLSDCEKSGNGVKGATECLFREIEGEAPPKISFVYGNRNSASCVLDLEAGVAQLVARFGEDSHAMAAAIKRLEPDDALAEALFFG